MWNTINNFLSAVDNFVWGVPLMVLIMAGGIMLTVRLGLLQIRKLPLALKWMVKNEEGGDGERRRRLDHPHGFFLPEVQSASILSSVCSIISFLAWRIHELCGKIK